MQRELNPFAPGSGRKPPAMTGRQLEIDDFDRIVARSKRRLNDRGLVLTGLRGVGKTVLLNFLHDHAARHGWFVVKMEGIPGAKGVSANREKLARSLERGRREFTKKQTTAKIKNALKSISSFSASVGVGGVEVGFEKSALKNEPGTLEIDLEELVRDLCVALKSEGLAFGLFLDEMQDIDGELLTALVTVQHIAGQNGWPFYIVGAGLPNLSAALGNVRTYAERLFDYHLIGPLTEAETRQALVEPAIATGARFEDEAIEKLVEVSGGYPYFIQEFGKAIWDLAPQSPFTAHDAEAAINYGWQQLDAGFFPARWERATPVERDLLVKMSSKSDTAVFAENLVTELGVSKYEFDDLAATLTEKGLIYSPYFGVFEFTVSGMADFVRRQTNRNAV